MTKKEKKHRIKNFYNNHLKIKWDDNETTVEKIFKFKWLWWLIKIIFILAIIGIAIAFPIVIILIVVGVIPAPEWLRWLLVWFR